MTSLGDIQTLLANFKQNQAQDLTEIAATSDKLREACNHIQDSWSGSFAGWHGKMYFRDFEAPSIHERFSGEWGGINGIPDGWKEQGPEQVTARIEQMLGNGFSADAFEKQISALRREAEGLKREVSIALSAMDTDSASSKDKQLAEQIEAFEFGRTKGEFIHDGLPGTMMSRDMEAIRQGTYIPGWLYYEGVALEGKAVCTSIGDFINLTDRLTRQLQMRASSGQAVTQNEPLKTLHPEIYAKCHQLYEKRAYAEAAEKDSKWFAIAFVS